MNNCSEFIRLHIVLPIAESIKHTCATKWLKQIERMQNWSHKEIVAWQEERLRAFIHHAYNHTMYYHRLFEQLGLKPKDIQCIGDLKKLPILTKETIREHYDEFIPDNVQEYPNRESKTGGTTGEPMRFLADEATWGMVTAMKIWAWRHTSYRYGDKFIALGSASLFKQKASLVRRIYDKIRNEIPLNCMNLSEDLCARYWEYIKKNNIHYIYGYASSIYLMAKYAHDYHIDVSFIKGAFTTSENLTSIYRKMIEDTFGCRVMDCYGARDAGMATYEVFPNEYCVSYSSILEIVDTFGKGQGRIVSTGVLNYAFPLIRYYFGDEGMLATEHDLVHYNGQVLKEIYGRSSDVLRLDNGHVLTSPGFTILLKQFDISAYNIQKNSGSSVVLQIVPMSGWNDKQEKQLFNEMQRFVGEGCKFSIEYVEHFEPLKNGKRRYFMNDVSK